jgi:dienelactone hydrolase
MKTTTLLLIALVTGVSAQTPPPAPKPQASPPPLPENVEKRSVIIWSDGTRMAGDLYHPKNLAPDAKAPAIILCAGTGGTKGGTQARIAPVFAKEGYVVLAFDYRGWGVSESQLMAVDQQPAPGEKNEMTINVRALRWQMNMTDQTEDIRAAISFIAGEPGVDKDRIGLWGSSYGGGLVTYMAGTDPRVKCTAAQVPGGLTPSTPAREAYAYDLATKQARGETEPVPLETGKLGGKMAKYDNMRVNPAKGIGYRAQEAIARINAPILFVVAENEELSSNAAVEQAHQDLTQRGIPSKYHVIKGITHYGVYREGYDEATRVELEWFNQHLKAPAN